MPLSAVPLPTGIEPVSVLPALAGDEPPRPSPGETPIPGAGPGWKVEPLQGWHLPLLDDPSFLPLHPLLQRSLLLALPDRLLTTLHPRRPLAPEVLIALRSDGPRPQALGLIASRRLNRSGTCWQLEHLRLALAAMDDPQAPGRQAVACGMLREAIQRARGATSWIATASSLDTTRLAALRQQGFQPQRTDRLWRWNPEPTAPLPSAPAELQLRPLQRRTAALLWHLEQATCPAPLRQLLDRRIEDLLDQSEGRGWMLVDVSRNEAVAGVRWLTPHSGGGMRVELSLHPGWGHLLGPATELLLRRLARGGTAAPLWIASEIGDDARNAWLEALGAEQRSEEVLMARSVWRRSDVQPARRAARRLEAVLEQLQPRRRPLPTPLQSGRLALAGPSCPGRRA